MKELLQKHKQYLLTGVSYIIPFIACGGKLVLTMGPTPNKSFGSAPADHPPGS